MEKIKQKIAQEVVKIEERKKIIEDELKEVQVIIFFKKNDIAILLKSRLLFVSLLFFF